MNERKPRLAFVSPVFLFPNDAGGKIRSTNILRGLKGGAFDVTLLSPASAAQQSEWAAELATACDRFVGWLPPPAPATWRRAFDVFGRLPVNVAPDRTPVALDTVRRETAEGRFDVLVFDFVHASVLMPPDLAAATVCFTHNVEAEIFERHASQARNPLMRPVWAWECRKMRRFEAEALRRYTSVVAVSERDAAYFRERCGVRAVGVIPTAVDLDYFGWRPPRPNDAAVPPTVVFCGSMNSRANIDGVSDFIENVWPRVTARLPRARFVVVGRHPSASLVASGREQDVQFTGFVDDVRPHVHAADVSVIPLQVGGGTRIKAFEAMAMGSPAVSTSIGIEGLDVVEDEHYLRCDAPDVQADAIVRLLLDPELRQSLSRRARQHVEGKFGHRVAAGVFERICLDAMGSGRSPRPAIEADLPRYANT